MGLVQEKHIENMILQALNIYGMFWKVEYPGFMNKKGFRKHSNKYVLDGMPDICGVISGKAYFLEVKTPKEKAKILRNWEKYLNYKGKSRDLLRYQRQIKRILELRGQGAVAEFVCSLDEALTAIGKPLSSQV